MTSTCSSVRRLLATAAAGLLAVSASRPDCSRRAPSPRTRPPHRHGPARQLAARGHRHRRQHGVPRLRAPTATSSASTCARASARCSARGPGTPAVGVEGPRRPALGGRRQQRHRPRRRPAPRASTAGDVHVHDRPRPFVNDVVLTDDAAWFTDSAQAAALPGVARPTGPSRRCRCRASGCRAPAQQCQRHRDHARRLGAARHQLLQRHPLPRRPGHAARRRRWTPAASSLTAGDGLLRQGRTLYVVQNRLNKIAVLRLSSDGTSAELTGEITSDRLRGAHDRGPLGPAALPARTPSSAR